ncbi:adherence factor [Chlamydia sp. 12-01]|uniref:adherence factor n=1 Tax=Chlamydia sp. 12-01 TaxID=3002742 RepID=UPI0035D44912
MSVNFFTPLCFSQECLGEIAQAGKSTLLEKLSGRLDSLFIQRSEGIEIKALGPNGELLCERVGKTDSITSLCLKVLLVLLIVPVIIALVLKIIVRLYLYLKYPGKVEEVTTPAPKPIVKPIVDPTVKPVVPPVTIEEVIEVKPKPLTREEIIEQFLQPFCLSKEDLNKLIQGVTTFTSRSYKTVGEYRANGILITDLPFENELPYLFQLTTLPGYEFTYAPGRLHEGLYGVDAITSITRMHSRLRCYQDETAKFLASKHITRETTREEIEAFIREGKKTNRYIGLSGAAIFRLGCDLRFASLGEEIGIFIEKQFN